MLLRKHDWSKESLLEAWMDDPALTCVNAGIQPPEGNSRDHVIHHITLLLAQGCHSDLAMDIIKISVNDDSIQVVMATAS